MDPNSFANTQQACLTHMHLDVKVDFERKIVLGKADLYFKSTFKINVD